MQKSIAELLDELEALLSELDRLPKGCLVTHKRKNDRCYYGHQFYENRKRREKYIRLADYPEWKKLFDRRKRVKMRISKIKAEIKKGKRQAKKIQIERHEARLAAEEKKLQKIQNGTAYMPEGQRYFTLGGEFVRSRDELALANHLFILGVKYVYEQRFYTPLGLVLPDFTIIADGQLVYIEHLGMLDVEEYRASWMQKLEKYKSADIKEGHNLICTYGYGPGNWLNMDDFDAKLREFGIIK